MKRALLMLLSMLVATAFLSPQNLPVQFIDVAEKIGVTFKHENGASPEKRLPETMSAGVVIFDYNNDDLPDLFFVNGGSFVDKKVAAGARHGLYRNTGNGKFANVTESSGIGIFGFGMGGCAADYDNDGWKDLFVAQGHVMDNIEVTAPNLRYLQPPLLLKNTRGLFAAVDGGPAFKQPWAGRGAAVQAAAVWK